MTDNVLNLPVCCSGIAASQVVGYEWRRIVGEHALPLKAVVIDSSAGKLVLCKIESFTTLSDTRIVATPLTEYDLNLF